LKGQPWQLEEDLASQPHDEVSLICGDGEKEDPSGQNKKGKLGGAEKPLIRPPNVTGEGGGRNITARGIGT